MWETIARERLKHLNIQLYPEQREPLFNPSRIKIIGGGERAGKSFISALYAICRAEDDAVAAGYQRPLLYWVIGADYEHARAEWEYMSDFFNALAETVEVSRPAHKDQKCILYVPSLNATVETVSGYDPKRVAQYEPDGIVGCELGLWEQELWDRAYGRLAGRKGWGIFSGSFESSESLFSDLWEMGQRDNVLDITSFKMPSWCNLSRYPGGYDDPTMVQLRAQMSEGRFLERHGGQPASPVDSVLPEFNRRLHVSEDIRFRPDLPVEIFIDPGHTVYAVLFVQFVEGEVWVVDEVYETQMTHEQIMQTCALKPSWVQVAANNAVFVMDFAGGQHHMGMGSPMDAWWRDVGVQPLAQKWPVSAQLDRLRSVLMINIKTGKPYLRISPRCRGILAELGSGPSPVSGVSRWRMRGGAPEHKNDHACKALAYGLLNRYGTKRVDARNKWAEPVTYLSKNVEQEDDIIRHKREGVNPWLKN